MSTTPDTASRFPKTLSLARWGAAVALLLSAGCAGSAANQAAAGPQSNAFAYYNDGCNAGDANACANAARALASPGSAVHDDALALQLRTRACNANAYYCGELGQMYLSGAGVQKDEPRGLSYLDRGCAAKNTAACSSASQVHNTEGAKLADPRPAAPAMQPMTPAPQATDAAPAAKTDKTDKKDTKKHGKKSKKHK